MKDIEYDCITHGWTSHYQVCPFCMILTLQEDIDKLKEQNEQLDNTAYINGELYNQEHLLVQELNQQLTEAIGYQIVLVNEKNQFRQQLAEAKEWNIRHSNTISRVEYLERQLAVSEELRLSGCEVIDQEQANIAELEQQLEEAHTELSVSIKERLVLGGQNATLEQQNANYYKSYQLYMERALDAESMNAKLVEALEIIAGDETDYPKQIAVEALKEVKGV